MRHGIIRKRSNLYVIGVPKGEERWNGTEAIFEDVMAMNFFKTDERSIKLQFQEAL